MELKWVKIKDVKPNPHNRNKHPKEQIERLSQIITYQGWRHPLIISNQSGMLVVGHGRLEAAKKLKLKEVPVVYQDFKDPEQEYAFGISDNAIALWAELDLSNIHTDLESLDALKLNLDMLGLKDFRFEPIDKIAMCDEDEIPEKVDAKSKLGDLYILGDHRLLCGDSTNIQHVERLMDGNKVDMVFTDPPYGMNLDTDYSSMMGTGKRHRKVIGDNEDFTPELIGTVFASAPDAKEVFMWGADYYSEHLPKRKEGSWFVWDKRSNENEIGKMDGQFGSSFELCWSKNRHQREIIRFSRPTSHWRGDEKSVHPTQKPIHVIEWFFKKYNGNNILDLFGGSGSTLIACEKTNRKCFMMELDPHYCDVIVARYEKYTGNKAVLT